MEEKLELKRPWSIKFFVVVVGLLFTIGLITSLFDLSKIEHQKIAFNWKNMQPSTDNSEKSNKIRINEFFNTFISSHRFIQLLKLNG